MSKKKKYPINKGAGCVICNKQVMSSYPQTKFCSPEHRREFKSFYDRVYNKFVRYPLVKKAVDEYKAKLLLDKSS